MLFTTIPCKDRKQARTKLSGSVCIGSSWIIKKAGKKAPKKKAKKEAAEEKPVLTPEEKTKQRMMSAIVAFNIAVILCMLVLNVFGSFSFKAAAAIAVLLGLAAVGGTFFVMKKLDL